MKAISLWQPWASLIAIGAKPYETRDWAPPRYLIGQRIAIHAAKKIDKDAVGLAEAVAYDSYGSDFATVLEALNEDTPDELLGKFGMALYPIGCVVCTAVLDAAFQLGDTAEGTARPAASVTQRMTSRDMPSCFTVRTDDFGNYMPGRWAWLLRDVQAIKPPAPVKGSQGFFDLPQGWLVGAPA